ncbi:hypothetical protein H0A65_11020 [Alcaligenaceae bacterium]|nr:hypothetical protein [Alcaligenaceae bacterium]
MLNWLRSFIGEPAPVHIHFDKGAVAVASPGDLVIFTSLTPLRTKERKSVEEFLALLKHKHPEIDFALIEYPLSGSIKGARR